MTYEAILQRMLDRVPSNLDKREGSIIFNALAPAAAELAQMYVEKQYILDQAFADTASREYLIKRAAERGLTPLPSSKAVLKGVFNIDIPIGSRFSIEKLNYKAVEKIDTGQYKMECEAIGSIGNTGIGALIPIDYIDGLINAENVSVLIPGQDEEDTELLRQRYFDSLESQSYGGNIADYKNKTKSLNGVGGVKVYPVWNGGGTVKLVIVDSLYKKPSNALVESVQTAIDPIPNQGEGKGLAPIGHRVTVESVNETIVDITTSITYESGYGWADVKDNVEAMIDDYFSELGAIWETKANVIVRVLQIESRLLNIGGIVDVQGTTLNGSTNNLVVPADSIPKRGTLNG